MIKEKRISIYVDNAGNQYVLSLVLNVIIHSNIRWGTVGIHVTIGYK